MNDKQEKPQEQSKVVSLSRCARILLFFTFVGLAISVSTDNGVASASSRSLRKDLDMTDSEFGLFGTFQSVGRILGSLVFMALLMTQNRKYLTVFTLGLNAACLSIFLITGNKWIILGSRIIIGIARVYPHIYIPVWVDQFGVQKFKTMMMTVLNFTSPIGQSLGFSIGTFMGSENWKFSFIIVGAMILVLALFFMFYPQIYYSSKLSYFKTAEGKEVLQPSVPRATSCFAEEAQKSRKDEGGMSEIIKNGTYLSGVFAKANLLFIFQAIHFWIGDYLGTGLGITDKKSILASYVFVSVVGPSTGSFIGGIVATFFGGYQNKNSVFVAIFFGALTCGVAVQLAFVTDLFNFTVFLFLFFVCSSGILPVLSGIIVTSIPTKYKGAGSSLSSLLICLGGNLPAPTVYGVINGYFKDAPDGSGKTIAWKCNLFYSFVGFIALCLACFLRYRAVAAKESSGLSEPIVNKDKDEKRTSKMGEVVAEVTSGEKMKLNKDLKSVPMAGTDDGARELKTKDQEKYGK